MARGCVTACTVNMQEHDGTPPDNGPYMRARPVSLNLRHCCSQWHDVMQPFQGSAGSVGHLSSAPSAPASGLPSQQEVRPAAALYLTDVTPLASADCDV